MAIEARGKPKEKLKVVLVDATAKAESEARDVAEEKMAADKEELKGFKGFLKRIWKHNLARGWYIRREYDKAREKILGSKNIYADETQEKSAHEGAMQTIVERFQSEYEEMVHREAGEKKDRLGNSFEEQQVKSEITKLIRDYAPVDLSSKRNQETFENEKNRILSQLSGIKREIVGKGSLFADNLLEVVKQVQAALEHGKKMEDLDLDLEVVIGRAKDRVRTEAQYSAVDKIVEKVTHSRFGCLVNETTLAGALSLGASVLGKISQAFARSKILKWSTFGATALVGAGVAAARESQAFEEERKRHFRDVARGKKFDFNRKPRRAEFERLRYETKAANELADSLERELYEYDSEGKRKTRELKREDFQNILNSLSEIESRIILSDRHKIDLISFSDSKKVEQEGLRLDLLRAQAKADLEKYLRQNPALSRQILGTRNLRDFTRELVEVKIEKLTKGDQGIEAKNRIAREMKRSKVWKAAKKGLWTGATVGLILQELKALVGGEEKGILEEIFGVSEAHAAGAPGLTGAEAQSYTALGYFYRSLTGNWPRMDTSSMQDVAFGSQHFSIPRGASLLKNPDGTLRLMRGEEIIADKLPVGSKGQLTTEARSIFEANDVRVKGGLVSEIRTEKLSPQEYIEKNRGMFRHIRRNLWYDNDTPAPVFDKNELKLWWGGKSGIDAKGNYVFSVKHMMRNGSFHKHFRVDAQDAMKSGKLKMLFSLSRGTQCDVVEVPIDASGNAVIDPNSETGKMFFKTVMGKNGPKAVFTGKFAEVAEMMGEKKGVDQVRILATHIGKGLGEVPVIEKIPPVIFDMPVPVEIEPPPFIPVFGRWPLESGKDERRGDVTYPYGYNYGYEMGGGGFGLLPREHYQRRISKKLLENRNIDLSVDDWDVVKSYIDDQDDNYQTELKNMTSSSEPMDRNVEVVVTIPSYKEGKNLEKTLRNYAKLKGRNNFEIVILENHPSGTERDNTEEVIKKIKKEFPDLKIVHLYKVFEKKPPIGLVRKYLVDSVLVRKLESGIRKSLAIVSNDADLEDISDNYADNIAKAFKQNKKLDAVGAKWDYPLETFKKFPLLHASQRLWHYLDIAFRHYYLRSPELIGRNSIFRSGIYAGVGGYNSSAELAEDLEIGWLIKYARNYDTERIGYLNSAWLKSNPRRAVVKMLSGGRLVQQYGDFHVNEDIRNASVAELLKEQRDFDLGELRNEIQAICDYYFQWRKSKGGWVEDIFVEKSFDRAMRSLGVEYKVTNDKVNIIDAERLIKGLNRYK